MRAGTHALSLLSVPLNVHVLTALADEPKPLVDLRRAVGSPPQTTMRGHLRTLTKLGVLERRRESDFPGSVDYELGSAGRELLGVVRVLQAWLANSPDGPLQPGSVAAKSAIKALTEGWSSMIVRALAARPLSLTQLNGLITGLSYPSLERRLGAMRSAGQIEACPNGGRGTPYATTEWLRRAMAPLGAAASWERRHVPAESAPIARMDIESAFLLTLPLLELPEAMSGSCRLAVETGNDSGEHQLAGVVVEVEAGRVASCVSRLQGTTDAWASGSVYAWLGAVIQRDTELLEIGGDCELAQALLEGLHGSLFTARLKA